MSDKPVIGKIEFGPALQAPSGRPPHVYTPAEELALSNALELVALTEKLAAKDAEIAELRARAHMLGSELREADLRAESYLQERSKAVSERDEARECVRRLHHALHAAVTDAGRWSHLDWIEALSTTPAHLR